MICNTGFALLSKRLPLPLISPVYFVPVTLQGNNLSTVNLRTDSSNQTRESIESWVRIQFCKMQLSFWVVTRKLVLNSMIEHSNYFLNFSLNCSTSIQFGYNREYGMECCCRCRRRCCRSRDDTKICDKHQLQMRISGLSFENRWKMKHVRYGFQAEVRFSYFMAK